MDWQERHAAALAATGATPVFHAGGDALAAGLGRHWPVDLVIVDLDLVTPSLAARLRPDGPRLLAFGGAANADLALDANLADFITADPTPAELAAAIDAALASSAPAAFADLSDRATARLGALGVEAARVASALARLDPTRDAPPPIDAERLRVAIRARRARDRYFPPEIFGEPAWDMLLDLAVAAVEGGDVAVSSLCIAAAVPTTTALRWIRTLCDAGLFDRREDPRDGRRTFISLSPAAEKAMARYLAQTASPWP